MVIAAMKLKDAYSLEGFPGGSEVKASACNVGDLGSVPGPGRSPGVSPSICHEVVGLDTMILVFGTLSFKPTFSLSSFTFIKRHFSSSSLSDIRLNIIFFI